MSSLTFLLITYIIYVYYISPGNEQMPSTHVLYKYTYVIRFTGGKLTYCLPISKVF